MVHILVIEDQKYPIESIIYSLKIAIAAVFPTESLASTTTITKSFNHAKREIEKGGWDVVILDHRLPYDDVGDLEDKDMKAFSAKLNDIGYSLIGFIKEKCPNVVLIGTSSMNDRELRGFGKPDFKVDKNSWDDLPTDFTKMLTITKEKMVK